MTHRPRTVLRVTALAAAVALSAGACAQIPQSSTVRSDPARDGAVQASDAPLYRPPGPAADADAEAIIRGFMLAGTGPQNDYAVAREYLAGSAENDWDPGRRTVVYSSKPTITRGAGEGAYQVQVEVESVVDEAGLRTMAPPGTTQAWNLTVQEIGGRPRITGTDDGVLLSRSQFSQLYAPQALAFYDPTFTTVVPDVRWFVNRSTRVTAVTRALLQGPAPYLTGAVATAFPLRTGGDLTGPSVPVSPEGVASVDLTAATVEGADAVGRHRMREQLRLSLEGISGITRVDVSVQGKAVVQDPAGGSPAPVQVDPGPGSMQVGVDPATGQLVQFQDLTVTPVGGLPDLGAVRPVDPAMTVDRTGFAFLDPGRRRLQVARTDGSLRTALTGTDLTGPSVDPHGWVWTVERGADSRIAAIPVQAAERPRVVTAPWLEEGEQIVDLRIGPAGARAALIVDDGARRTLRVAGVVRGSDGVPSSLTEPMLLATAESPDLVRWVDSVTLVVTPVAPDAETDVQPEIVPLAGGGRQLFPLAGVRGLSVGGTSSLYAETEDGVSLLVGSSWRAQELSQPVTDLAFPG
ncbi:LpqB family beta-propeller domain-containing protein [Micrococcus sp.]|uniref:LpqB family beta-propeller domain-containing protein n=1 Tax=Micrococcus sp. TaxID=1271 RepID=UPI002A91D490|nr:LpqB family beta-propeller domain-containing protein [Micrococcus sp.]MDY6055893.1 LpqB family beta-propeller domain-containing protein [Micrococcus sp.]